MKINFKTKKYKYKLSIDFRNDNDDEFWVFDFLTIARSKDSYFWSGAITILSLVFDLSLEKRSKKNSR